MPRSVFEAADPTLAIKGVLPIKTMVGFGMMLGSLPGLVTMAINTISAFLF